MARTPELDEEVRALAREHMAAHGRNQWEKLEALTKELGYSKADTWEVVTPVLAEELARPVAAGLADADFPEPAEPPVIAKAPRVPSERPIRPLRVRSNLERLNSIDDSVSKLEAYSLKPDPESEDGTAIKFPVIFASTIDKRITALQLNLKIGESLYDLDRVRYYLNRIGEIVRDRIAPMAPEVQQQILEDMDALNAEFTRMEPETHGPS